MTISKIEEQRESRKKRYRQNIFEERRQSRLRARSKRDSRSAEEVADFLEKHRAAQARYRESRRKELAFKAREYRRRKASQRERERDAELLAEFELMLAEGNDDATFEEAARRLQEKTGRHYKL